MHYNHWNNSIFLILVVLGGLLFFCRPAAAADWYSQSWGYREVITVVPSQASSTLSNFPALVSTTSALLKDAANGGHVASSTGRDILFTAADGVTKLNHELEVYASSTGQVLAWVMVPSFSTTTEIYMYYGNPTAADQSSSSWWGTAGYRNVFHFENSAASGLFYESVTGAMATSSGAPVSTSTGKIGGAVAMPSTGAGGGGQFATSTFVSASFWIRKDSSTAFGLIVGALPGRDSSNGGIYYLSSTQKVAYVQSNTTIASSTPIATSTWTHVVMANSVPTVGGVLYTYVNGVLTHVSPANSTNRLVSRFGTDGTDRFGGSIDELRVASTTVSAAWALTEYNNQSAPASFWTFGAEVASSSADLVRPSVAWTAPADAATVAGTVVLTATSSDNIGVAAVTFYHGTTTIGVVTSSPFSLSWNTNAASTPNGAYTLNAIAEDAAGNTASSTIDVTVDNPIIKIMPLGDSITRGDWHGGYRSRLYCQMQAGGLFNYDFVGRSTEQNATDNLPCAWPTAYQDHEGYNSATINVSSSYVWSQNIALAMNVSAPDIILLMLGTNDVYSTIRTAPQIRSEMSSLLDQIWSADPSAQVVLSTIPHNFDGDNIKAAIIQETNALWPGLAAEKQVDGRRITLVDNYAALSTSSDFLGDGIHPDSPGYIKMMGAWYLAVSAILTDATAPSVSWSSPANSSTATDTIALTATASDDMGTTTVTFLDGTTFIGVATSAPYTVSWDTTGVADGAHTLLAMAADVAGNVASSSISVTVDNHTDETPPTVFFTYPVDNYVATGTLVITATAIDDTAMAGVQFKLDGVNLGGEDTSAPFSFSWDTYSTSNATHTLLAVARDTAGNHATSSPLLVGVANHPLGPIPVYSDALPFPWSFISDATVGVTTTQVYAGTSSVGVISPSGSALVFADYSLGGNPGPGVSTAGRTRLAFYIYPVGSDLSALSVRLNCHSSAAYLSICSDDIFSHNAVNFSANQWNEVNWPLSEFTSVGVPLPSDAYVDTVRFSNGGAGTSTYFVDNIKFFTPDITPPVVTLTGKREMSIYRNTAFADPGATALDDFDDVLSATPVGAVDTSTVGVYTIVYTAIDTTANAATTSRTVNILAVAANAMTISTTTSVTTVTTTTPEVLVGDNNTADSAVTVPLAVTSAALNMSALALSNSTSTVITTVGAITVNAATAAGEVRWEMPSGDEITAASTTWDAIISLPQARDNASVTVPPDSGFTASVAAVVEIGAGSMPLTFSRAVRITFFGQAGQLVGYSYGGAFTKITSACAANSQSAGDALSAGGDCQMSVGSDLIVWTKHFSSFVVYSQTAIAAPGGGQSLPSHNLADTQLTTNGAPVANEPDSSLGLAPTVLNPAAIAAVIQAEREATTVIDGKLVNRLRGRILLQVESRGEVWYVNPVEGKRYYLADGPTAYQALRQFGLGITSANLALIPVGYDKRFVVVDFDSDGLPDKMEEAIGTDPTLADSDADGYDDATEVRSGNNPLTAGRSAVSATLVQRLRGRILLQVESRGEAWYVNPVVGQRYYLADGNAAYQIMSYLSLGITNADLRKIEVGEIK